MSKPLRLLQVEDSESDAALILRNLERAGYDVTSERVETAADMREALARVSWDIIISDYRMPLFDAPAALGVLQETGADIPFLVVSGTIGEDAAVAVMRAGAHDYLMKDKLTRLAPAVEREIRDAAMRKKQRDAEEALRESERCYRLISEHSGDVVWAYDVEAGHFTYVSPSVQQMQGYTPGECLALSLADFLLPSSAMSLPQTCAAGWSYSEAVPLRKPSRSSKRACCTKTVPSFRWKSQSGSHPAGRNGSSLSASHATLPNAASPKPRCASRVSSTSRSSPARARASLSTTASCVIAPGIASWSR
jgi:CheY-like chemotaxis protein